MTASLGSLSPPAKLAGRVCLQAKSLSSGLVGLALTRLGPGLRAFDIALAERLFEKRVPGRGGWDGVTAGSLPGEFRPTPSS